jgi:quercetin dioxygenase-like cupin family protein
MKVVSSVWTHRSDDAMEIITAVMETKPGEEIPLHTHHGSEAGYVIQGATIQPPGKEPIELKTGGDFLFARDVPHAGFKVVGNVPLKLFTVHVVDKGKPLSEIVAK